MGGRGSGRNGGVPTAERLRSLIIDVNKVMGGYAPAHGVRTRWVCRAASGPKSTSTPVSAAKHN
jgi:hypothetical protein